MLQEKYFPSISVRRFFSRFNISLTSWRQTGIRDNLKGRDLGKFDAQTLLCSPRTPADAFSSAVHLPAVHLSPSSCAALHGAHEARQAAASMLPCHGMQQALLTNISKRNQTGHNEGRLCRREGGLHLTKEKDI